MLIPVTTQPNVYGSMPSDTAPDDRRELGLRLRAYIRASGKTQAKVAEEIGTDPTYMSQLVNGRVNWVTSQYFMPLAHALNLSVAEIQDINPRMVINSLRREATWNGGIDRRASQSNAVQDGGQKSHSTNLNGGNMVTSDTTFPFVEVSVYGLATAGPPGNAYTPEATLNVISHEIIPRSKYRNGNTLPMYASGDSMSPTIEDGELVVADKSLTDLVEDFMYLVQVGNEGVCVKRALLLGDTWLLASDNRAYKPFQAEDAVILGQVYWSQPRGKDHNSRGRLS